MAFEHAERDAEEDVESIKEQDIPYAEKRLNKNKIKTHSISYFTKRQRDTQTTKEREKARYLDG